VSLQFFKKIIAKEERKVERPLVPKLAGTLVVALVMLLAAGSVQADLTIGTNFTGQTMIDSPALNSEYRFIPPDTNGAVGPNHVVELINGAYAVYSKTGAFVQSTGLDTFWANAGVTPSGAFPTTFDPRVVYDPVSSRWFASALDSGSGTGSNFVNNFLVAVSKSSDPTDGWTGFKIAGAPGTGTANGRFTDFDTLGFNKDQVYLTANNFPNNFQADTTTIVAVPKSSLLAGNTNNLSRFDLLNPNDTGYEIQALIDPNGTGTALLYSGYNTPAGNLKRSQLLNTNTNSPTLNTTNQLITATAYGLPPKAIQKNGPNTIETGDNRFSGSVVKGGDGKVWAVQSVTYNGHAALRWVQIDPTSNLVLQEGLIAKAGFDYYYGSIAVNSKGCVVIGFSGSSADTFISAYAVEGETILGSTTFTDAILLKAGTHSYDVDFSAGRNRWGDYSATWIDPTNDNIFWTFQEWASDFSTVYNSDTWSTQITELICQPIPLPSTLMLLGSGLLSLAGLRRFRKS
jgi:hypothetical protein